MSTVDELVVRALGEQLDAEPEGECEYPKLTQAEAFARVTDHGEICRPCMDGYKFSAYVCPDWGGHWHVMHVWRPGIDAQADAGDVEGA